ncbi:MAG TPA: hypothetical protein VFY29_11900 [Terriglobia bacterium]|nr:hypothetical protein [Terriglobia bacterium]
MSRELPAVEWIRSFQSRDLDTLAFWLTVMQTASTLPGLSGETRDYLAAFYVRLSACYDRELRRGGC